MHPAPSLVVFTVLTGLGLGLMALLGLGLGPDDGAFRWIAPVVGVALTGAGGLASVSHLARPDRAWRAFSQWRSSWLSREACFLVMTVAVFAAHVGLWCLADLRIAPLGWLAAALALATVYCTAMIYAQLATVPRWSATPTPLLFLVLSLTGGLLLGGGLLGLTGGTAATARIAAAVVIAAAMMVWWQTQAAGANRASQGSDLGTATGLSLRGRVRQLEAPHTGRNYLLDEMAFRVGRERAFQLRRIGAWAGFVVPLILVGVSWLLGDWVLLLAVISHVGGMIALRWLFFAEAEHVQALYYGQR